MDLNFYKNKELMDFIIKNTFDEEIAFDNTKVDKRLNLKKMQRVFIFYFLENLRVECRKFLEPSLYVFIFLEIQYIIDSLSLDSFIHANNKIINQLKNENKIFLNKIKIQFKNEPLQTSKYQTKLQLFYYYKITRHINCNLLCRNMILFCLKLCNVYVYKPLDFFQSSCLFAGLYIMFNTLREYINEESIKSKKNIILEDNILINIQELTNNYNIIYECGKETEHFNNVYENISDYYNKKKHQNNNYIITHDVLQFELLYDKILFWLKVFITTDKYIINTIQDLNNLIILIVSTIREIKSLDLQYKKDYDEIMKLKQNKKNKKIQIIPYSLDKSTNILFNITDYSFKYKKNILFEKCNINIYGNCWTIFYGNSGCGKTTLCNILLKQITQNYTKSGTILYLNKYSKYEYESIRENISYVKPSFDLFDNSILYNIHYGVKKIDKTQTDNYLVKYGLGHIIDNLNENINILSTGEKQRIKIIRLILQDKKIWILDEITSNINNEMEKNILQDLKRIQQEKKKTIIHITHNLDNKLFADKLLLIKDKKIMYE